MLRTYICRFVIQPVCEGKMSGPSKKGVIYLALYHPSLSMLNRWWSHQHSRRKNSPASSLLSLSIWNRSCLLHQSGFFFFFGFAPSPGCAVASTGLWALSYRPITYPISFLSPPTVWGGVLDATVWFVRPPVFATDKAGSGLVLVRLNNDRGLLLN